MDLPEYNARTFQSKGLNRWRRIYLNLLGRVQPSSVVEFGAGDPELLKRLSGVTLRLAVDGTDCYRQDFEAAEIPLEVIDLNMSCDWAHGEYDVAICSDVFEHLLDPLEALKTIRKSLRTSSILLAHVPNEFRFGPLLKIALGVRESVQFHRGVNEWNDPHLRRFTDLGFTAFLRNEFEYTHRLTHLGSERSARLLWKAFNWAPYCLQGGPTYACTNDSRVSDRLSAIIADLS